ncbi:MAG TPA: hypothetical protein VF188_18130 [Longimicrobiales bacterium]
MVTGSGQPEPNGFGLVEVVVATVILAFGILAMAVSTGYMFAQLRFSDRTTERAIAVRQVFEEIRAMPYDAILSRSSGSAEVIGDYRLWWDVTTMANMKSVSVICEGPGFVSGESAPTVVTDTFALTVLNPR